MKNVVFVLVLAFAFPIYAQNGLYCAFGNKTPSENILAYKTAQVDFLDKGKIQITILTGLEGANKDEEIVFATLLPLKENNNLRNDEVASSVYKCDEVKTKNKCKYGEKILIKQGEKQTLEFLKKSKDTYLREDIYTCEN
jgi:hypothetical protein